MRFAQRRISATHARGRRPATGQHESGEGREAPDGDVGQVHEHAGRAR
jgi:hypothetical protein